MQVTPTSPSMPVAHPRPRVRRRVPLLRALLRFQPRLPLPLPLRHLPPSRRRLPRALRRQALPAPAKLMVRSERAHLLLLCLYSVCSALAFYCRMFNI